MTKGEIQAVLAQAIEELEFECSPTAAELRSIADAVAKLMQDFVIVRNLQPDEARPCGNWADVRGGTIQCEPDSTD